MRYWLYYNDMAYHRQSFKRVYEPSEIMPRKKKVEVKGSDGLASGDTCRLRWDSRRLVVFKGIRFSRMDLNHVGAEEVHVSVGEES